MGRGNEAMCRTPFPEALFVCSLLLIPEHGMSVDPWAEQCRKTHSKYEVRVEELLGPSVGGRCVFWEVRWNSWEILQFLHRSELCSHVP